MIGSPDHILSLSNFNNQSKGVYPHWNDHLSFSLSITVAFGNKFPLELLLQREKPFALEHWAAAQSQHWARAKWIWSLLLAVLLYGPTRAKIKTVLQTLTSTTECTSLTYLNLFLPWSIFLLHKCTSFMTHCQLCEVNLREYVIARAARGTSKASRRQIPQIPTERRHCRDVHNCYSGLIQHF